MGCQINIPPLANALDQSVTSTGVADQSMRSPRSAYASAPSITSVRRARNLVSNEHNNGIVLDTQDKKDPVLGSTRGRLALIDVSRTRHVCGVETWAPMHCGG